MATSIVAYEATRDRGQRIGKMPPRLLVINSDYYKTVKLDYRGGAKYPHIERDTSKPDLLQAITRPLQTSISPTK